MNKPISHYIMLNRKQPVKIYTKAEIEEYKKTKSISFFLLPSKLERAFEEWVDSILPKTAIYESKELENTVRLLRASLGRCTTNYNNTGGPTIYEYSYVDLLEKTKGTHGKNN